MNTEEILKCFKRDTKEHSMTVYRNNGLYRHLGFSRNYSSTYHFDLVTWPGFLAITGDMGEYVFSRCPDMFSFFRMSENDFNKRRDGELSINPRYWGEKVRASKNGIEEFSLDAFHIEVKRRLSDSISDFPSELVQEIIEEIENDSSWPTDEIEAWSFVRDFDFEDILFSDEVCEAMSDEDLTFPDEPLADWEDSCSEFKFHYIWCLYAIVWGISLFDELAAANKK